MSVTDDFENAQQRQAVTEETDLNVCRLSYDDLDAFLNLQQAVIDFHAAKGRTMLVVPRTIADLTAHLDADMPILGIKDLNGALRAQCLLTYPDNPSAINIGHYPVDCPEQTVVIQSFVVDPEYRGPNLSGILFNAGFEKASESGRGNLLIAVVEKNRGVIRNIQKYSHFRILGRSSGNTLEPYVYLSRDI